MKMASDGRKSPNSNYGDARSNSADRIRSNARKRYPVHYNQRSMEMLPPEVMIPHDLELELEDYGSSGSEESESEYSPTENDDATTNYTTTRTSEIFRIADPTNMNNTRENTRDQLIAEQDEYSSSRELTLFGSLADDTEIDMDSEEERDIVKQIKEEITNQVKEEMAGELAVYKYKREKLKTPAEGNEKENNNSDLDGLEPQLKDAFIKMRKLDRILKKKVKKEKDVKRDRILLQKRLREELEDIKSENPDESRDSQQNTSKFLALTLPASHNAGIIIEENEAEPTPPVTPVFQTQVLDESMGGSSNLETPGRSKPQSARSGTTHRTDATSQSNLTTDSGDSKSATTSKGGGKKKKGKDFIRRNIQLASDAGNQIAMTDDEKQRVEGLLANLDALQDIQEDESLSDIQNPFQVAIGSGEGFLPTSEEMKRLTDIDSRLKVLLPEEDFVSIASTTPRLQSSHQTLFTRTGVDIDELGEKALKETKEQQVLKQRMQDIEHELGRLTSAVELEIESPTLSDPQLQSLLDQCARTMARASEDVTSIANSSARLSDGNSVASVSRAELYENAPKLPEDVLQQLLSDARQTLGSSAPSTSRTETNSQEQMVLESVTEDTIRELLKDSRATSSTPLRMNNQNSYGVNNTLDREYIESDEEDNESAMYSSEANMTDHHKQLNHALNSLRQQKEQDALPRRSMSGRRSEQDRSPERRPFLPEIDPTGSMATVRPNNTTRLNNESRPPSSGRSSAVTVRNSFSDINSSSHFSADIRDRNQWGSRENTPTPPQSQPPNFGRTANSGANVTRPRTLSPIVRNPLDR